MQPALSSRPVAAGRHLPARRGRGSPSPAPRREAQLLLQDSTSVTLTAAVRSFNMRFLQLPSQRRGAGPYAESQRVLSGVALGLPRSQRPS